MAVGARSPCRGAIEAVAALASGRSWDMPAASKSTCSNGAPSRCGGPAVTGSEGLDEWSLVGLTREQGLTRWSAIFMGLPPVSRMTMSTSWGWVTWAPTDAEAAHIARMAGRIPPPLLVEIAVSDPDSTNGGRHDASGFRDDHGMVRTDRVDRWRCDRHLVLGHYGRNFGVGGRRCGGSCWCGRCVAATCRFNTSAGPDLDRT